jgi:hypothetical protein
MKQIILEDHFEFKQKAILIILSVLPLLFMLSFLINFKRIHDEKFIASLLIFILSFLLFSFFTVLIFSKKGIRIDGQEIYWILTFAGKSFYSKKINRDYKSIFTVLSKNVLQKNIYLSTGGADLSYKYINHEFVALSNNHLVKEHLITVNSQDKMMNLKMMLESNSALKYEMYSPNK